MGNPSSNPHWREITFEGKCVLEANVDTRENEQWQSCVMRNLASENYIKATCDYGKQLTGYQNDNYLREYVGSIMVSLPISRFYFEW